MTNVLERIYDIMVNDMELKRVEKKDLDTISSVSVPYFIEGGPTYTIHFITGKTDDDDDVSVRVINFVEFDDDKMDTALKVVNELNSSYRFIKFTLDEKGKVCIEYDFLSSIKDPEKHVSELLIRITRILNKAYPVLMKAKWA